MSGKNIVCWKCGEKLPSHCLPIRHYDLCPHCRADLHTCLMCRSFDPNASAKCRKEEADYVSHKERANYCHYFQARPNAHKAPEDRASKALNDLAALFGDSQSAHAHLNKDYKQTAQESKETLHDLFGATYNKDEALSPEERARQELEKLFGKKD